MSQLISASQRHQLHDLFVKLGAETVPHWGKMKPQQMVEHLADAVSYTNGKKVTTCERPAADAERSKQASVYTDKEIPRNVILEELPQNYLYADLSKAIEQLMIEVSDFDEYFKVPGITSVHPAFGAMNYDEWIKWHSKHFTHHFKQFGLLPL